MLDEETDGLGVVGVYATVEDCAEACHSFINEFDPDEEIDGPIDNVVVLAAGAPSPGARRFRRGQSVGEPTGDRGAAPQGARLTAVAHTSRCVRTGGGDGDGGLQPGRGVRRPQR